MSRVRCVRDCPNIINEEFAVSQGHVDRDGLIYCEDCWKERFGALDALDLANAIFRKIGETDDEFRDRLNNLRKERGEY